MTSSFKLRPEEAGYHKIYESLQLYVRQEWRRRCDIAYGTRSGTAAQPSHYTTSANWISVRLVLLISLLTMQTFFRIALIIVANRFIKNRCHLSKFSLEVRGVILKTHETRRLVTLLEFSTLPEGQTNGWIISRTRSRYSRSRYGATRVYIRCNGRYYM